MIVTGISLIRWLLVGGGLVRLLSIGFGRFALHQRIEFKIDEVKRL
jgi:hypothetical protein